MHFTTLFILKGETLDTIGESDVIQLFGERFCYACGETTPKYQYWCDWFQIGGRWGDMLQAKKGIHCERNWSNDNAPIVEDEFAIVEIKDLTAPLPRGNIYSVATKSRIYLKSEDWNYGNVNPVKFNELLDKIDKKEIKGIIAFIDCHD